MYVLAFGFASFLTGLFGNFHPDVVIPAIPFLHATPAVHIPAPPMTVKKPKIHIPAPPMAAG